MSDERTEHNDLHERALGVVQRLSDLAAEAAAADPALRARLDAALRALSDGAPATRNTAILEDPIKARNLVRDVVAEELDRYWQRRFGRTP